jgi:hypothetical protein
MRVALGAGESVDVEVDATTKGNGTLRIAGELLHVIDGHDDGITFENGRLEASFVDLDGDGVCELVLAGAIIFDDPDQGYDPPVREPVLHVYRIETSPPRLLRMQ